LENGVQKAVHAHKEERETNLPYALKAQSRLDWYYSEESRLPEYLTQEHERLILNVFKSTRYVPQRKRMLWIV